MRVFRFEILKAIEATAFLLRREKFHRMNYMRLLKVLYLAERESLRTSGTPITGSVVLATKRGPILDDILALIRSQHIATPQWSEYFHLDRYELEMVKDPGVGNLSPFTTNLLEGLAQQHEHRDEWEMAQLTRDLDEWKRNEPGDATRPIPVEHILEAIGRDKDRQRIIDAARAGQFIADFFAEPTATHPVAP